MRWPWVACQRGYLVSHHVYDVGVSIASTSVTPEHRYRCRCKRRVSTRTPIGFAMLCASGCEFQAHTVGVVHQLSDLVGSNHRESAHSWAVGYVCGGYGRNRHGRAICSSALVAKYATATFLTRLCSEKFTIWRQKLSIAQNSAFAGMAIRAKSSFHRQR